MEFNTNCLHVFLDLEQTLIDSWDNPMRLNTSQLLMGRLVNLKQKHPDCQFHIFSFAIWDVVDIFTFNEFRSNIEEFFNIKITHVIPRDKVLIAVKKIRNVQMLDADEMSQLFGKTDSWIDFCKSQMIHSAILFDDKTDEMEMTLRFNGQVFKLSTVEVSFS